MDCTGSVAINLPFTVGACQSSGSSFFKVRRYTRGNAHAYGHVHWFDCSSIFLLFTTTIACAQMTRCDTTFAGQQYLDSDCTREATGAGATLSGPTDACSTGSGGSYYVTCSSSISAAQSVVASAGVVVIGFFMLVVGGWSL